VADNEVVSDRVLSQSVVTATIDAPIARVDIADWLLHLPDAEYQRCAPPDHKAAGYTTTDDGRPMSINVEMIGDGLVVQHYVVEIAEPAHCHLVSLSDVLTPNGWTTTQVIWDLRAEAADDKTSTYTNTVISHPTAEFMAFLDKLGVPFDKAAAARQDASAAHNRLETPHYAASIGRRAMGVANT